MKKRKRGSIVKRVIWVLAALLLIGGGLAAWFWYGSGNSNPHNYKTMYEASVFWFKSDQLHYFKN